VNVNTSSLVGSTYVIAYLDTTDAVGNSISDTDLKYYTVTTAPPFVFGSVNDSFTGANGSTPNSVIWSLPTTAAISSSRTISNNTLVMTQSASVNGNITVPSYLGITSTVQISGDYSIDVDVLSLSGTSKSLYAGLETPPSSGQDVGIYLLNWRTIGNASVWDGWSVAASGGNGVWTYVLLGTAFPVNLKLRSRRFGSTTALYYSHATSGGWKLVAVAALNTLPVRPSIFNVLADNTNNVTTCTTTFDNYILNSGTIVSY